MKSLSVFSFFPLLFAILIFAGCNQQENSPVEGSIGGNDDSFLAKQYNLPKDVMQELQEAKIATARYNNLENAIADGYEDINVVMPNMGHHYMKANYVDGIFEIDKPEILVYSPHPVTGNMRLVAVEYAIPNTEPEPAGFTGSYDVWANNAGFGLWLLHAWVWEYNPDGVFNPTNPLVP
ncbi:MAG TPA: hypothetical protein VF870_11415 [Ignavibacteriaceae bacterium]|jgi:hypothetical protein